MNKMSDPLILFVILRRDLQFSAGAVIAQACHATSLVVFKHAAHENVLDYFKDFNELRKVMLEVKNEAALLKVSEALKSARYIHELWREQPENEITALAILPYKRSDELRQLLKKCQLYK